MATRRAQLEHDAVDARGTRTRMGVRRAHCQRGGDKERIVERNEPVDQGGVRRRRRDGLPRRRDAHSTGRAARAFNLASL